MPTAQLPAGLGQVDVGSRDGAIPGQPGVPSDRDPAGRAGGSEVDVEWQGVAAHLLPVQRFDRPIRLGLDEATRVRIQRQPADGVDRPVRQRQHMHRGPGAVGLDQPVVLPCGRLARLHPGMERDECRPRVAVLERMASGCRVRVGWQPGRQVVRRQPVGDGLPAVDGQWHRSAADQLVAPGRKIGPLCVGSDPLQRQAVLLHRPVPVAEPAQ